MLYILSVNLNSPSNDGTYKLKFSYFNSKHIVQLFEDILLKNLLAFQCDKLIIISLILIGTMRREISSVNLFSMDVCKNMQMKRVYKVHKNKIDSIGRKKSQYQSIQVEQDRIRQILDKSRKLSRAFQAKQFDVGRKAQNHRMINVLSRLASRNKDYTQPQQMIESPIKQIQALDSQSRQASPEQRDELEPTISIKRYRNKLKSEISEYLGLRKRLQRFKPGKAILAGDSVTYSLQKSKPRANLFDQISMNQHRHSNHSISLPPLKFIIT